MFNQLEALSYRSSPLLHIIVVIHKNNMDINICKKNNLKSIPKINILDGTEHIIAIGKIVNNVFLNHFLYIESGLLEYLINSPANQPAYEKFLNQKDSEAIINSNE